MYRALTLCSLYSSVHCSSPWTTLRATTTTRYHTAGGVGKTYHRPAPKKVKDNLGAMSPLFQQKKKKKSRVKNRAKFRTDDTPKRFRRHFLRERRGRTGHRSILHTASKQESERASLGALSSNLQPYEHEHTTRHSGPSTRHRHATYYGLRYFKARSGHPTTIRKRTPSPLKSILCPPTF